MKNLDDEIKQILRNMYSSSKTYLNEGEDNMKTLPSVRVRYKGKTNLPKTLQQSLPGNADYQQNRIIHCKTGKTYVSPNIIPGEKLKKWDGNLWYKNESKKMENSKGNHISACSYYARILVDHFERKVGQYKEIPFYQSLIGSDTKKKEKPDYDKEYTDCLSSCFASENSFVDNCTQGFTYEFYNPGDNVEDKKYNIEFLPINWWTTEYAKYLKDNDYTPNHPMISITKSDYYTILDEGSRVFNIEDMLLTKSEESTLETSVVANYDKTTKYLEIPLSDEEIQKMESNPFSSDGKFKKGDKKMVCKKPGVDYLNIRTDPEVNNDTGMLDYKDTYINWTSQNIIGELVGEVEMPPAKARYDDDTNKFLYSITLSEFGEILYNQKKYYNYDMKWYSGMRHPESCGPEIHDMTKNYYYTFGIQEYLQCSWDGENKEMKEYAFRSILKIINGDETANVLPKSVYERMPKKYTWMKWYKIQLDNELLDQSEYTTNYYSIVYVRSDNARICEFENLDDADTTFDMEALKRLPIKGLYNPGGAGYESTTQAGTKRVGFDEFDKEGRVVKFGGPKY